MATMQCPECGTQYSLSTTRCPDCDVDLVETLAGDDPIDSEQVTYELGEWSGQARVLLEQLMAGADIARAWSGTDLVVRAADEKQVDELVEQVRVTDEPALDPEAEKIVYEVNDWTSDQLNTLTDGLGERGIGYEFDVEGDLVVLASDEQGVESLLDVIEFGSGNIDGSAPAPSHDSDEQATDEPLLDVDDVDDDPDGGLETAGILSDLFVAVDRLQKDAHDHEGVLGAVGAAERLADRPLPFGYVPSVWTGIQQDASQLRDDIEGDEVTDDELQERAGALRAVLRQYV